jgi:hypothetical protein
MKLRARLAATSTLGLGIALVLAAATSISHLYIESTATRSRAPVLRPAAVFAPTLLGSGAGEKEIDAVSGFTPHVAIAEGGGKRGSAGTTNDVRAAHAPVPVPEELLLSLAPPLAGDAPAPPAAARTSPAAKAPPAPRPAEPRLEMIDDNLWRP